MAWIIDYCELCNQNRSFIMKMPLTVIFNSNSFKWVQINLINIKIKLDETYIWILHAKINEWELTTIKVSWHFFWTESFRQNFFFSSLSCKHAVNVTDVMIFWLMCFEPKKYAQTENENEFKKTFLILLKRHDIEIINENLKHSQSQNLVKQNNGTIKTQIHVWMKNNKIYRWFSELLKISLSFHFINVVLWLVNPSCIY